MEKMVYIFKKIIEFNDGSYSYNRPISFIQVLDSEWNIEIKKSKYALKAGYGKGIQRKK